MASPIHITDGADRYRATTLVLEVPKETGTLNTGERIQRTEKDIREVIKTALKSKEYGDKDLEWMRKIMTQRVINYTKLLQEYLGKNRISGKREPQNDTKLKQAIDRIIWDIVQMLPKNDHGSYNRSDIEKIIDFEEVERVTGFTNLFEKPIFKAHTISLDGKIAHAHTKSEKYAGIKIKDILAMALKFPGTTFLFSNNTTEKEDGSFTIDRNTQRLLAKFLSNGGIELF